MFDPSCLFTRFLQPTIIISNDLNEAQEIESGLINCLLRPRVEEGEPGDYCMEKGGGGG